MVKTSSKGLLIDSYDYFKKRSIIEFILYIVGGMLTLSLFINLINPTKEGFGVQKKMVNTWPEKNGKKMVRTKMVNTL